MSKNPFESRAIAWLRDAHHVDLPPLSPTRPQSDSGRSPRRLGEIATVTSAGKWGFGGLLSVTIGAVLSLVASRPGMGATLTQAVKWGAWAAFLLGLGGIAYAWRARAKNRPVCVHFVAGGKAPHKAQLETVEVARADDFAGEIWIVSDAPWSAEALAAVGSGRIRCFEPSAAGFAERTPC